MPPRPACLAVLALLAALPLAAGEDAADLAARKARLAQEVRELRALEAAGRAGSLLLDGVGRSMPEMAWLDELSLEADGRARVAGRAFNTDAVARFVENLDAVPEFAETTLRETTLTGEPAEDSEATLYSFEIAFRLSLAPTEAEVPAANLRAEVAALERERDELSRRLARREDVPRILNELRTMAGELDFGSSSFVEARTGSAKAARIDVDLSATFHGLATLLDRLKTLSALVALDELTVRQELSERGTIAASFRLRIPLRPPAS